MKSRIGLRSPEIGVRPSLMEIELSFSVATRSAPSSALVSCDTLSRRRAGGSDGCGRVESGAEVLGILSGGSSSSTVERPESAVESASTSSDFRQSAVVVRSWSSVRARINPCERSSTVFSSRRTRRLILFLFRFFFSWLSL